MAMNRWRVVTTGRWLRTESTFEEKTAHRVGTRPGRHYGSSPVVSKGLRGGSTWERTATVSATTPASTALTKGVWLGFLSKHWKHTLNG